MISHKTNYRGLVLLAATTLVVAACSSSDNDYRDPPPPAANSQPAISGISDRSVDQDTAIGPIEFGIADRESDASLLTVAAAADGAGVVVADGITLEGTGAVRSITLTPLEAATGTVDVTLRVTDPQGAAGTRTFRVTVNARSASLRDAALSTFAKAESDEVTVVNGFTFTQDADDPAIFEPLIGTGEE
ncbi:MAG TPA: hypothetical protein VFS58_08485 [Steroidobacteraceae bacterium]|nr:hypothetical protein [Steroidobacteraceae bacterium]